MNLTVLVALVASLAACAPVSALQPGELRAWVKEWRPGAVEWDVIATADAGRAVVVGYMFGCGMRNVRATVHEGPGWVKLRVRDEQGVWETEPPGHVMSCPAAQHAQLAVRLRRPLAGRHVYGRPSGDRGALYTGGCDARAVCWARTGPGPPVPELAGLSPRQATHALALAGLGARVRRAATRGGLLRVIAERPRAGRAVAQGTTVTVVVSRVAQSSAPGTVRHVGMVVQIRLGGP